MRDRGGGGKQWGQWRWVLKWGRENHPYRSEATDIGLKQSSVYFHILVWLDIMLPCLGIRSVAAYPVEYIENLFQ